MMHSSSQCHNDKRKGDGEVGKMEEKSGFYNCPFAFVCLWFFLFVCFLINILICTFIFYSFFFSSTLWGTLQWLRADMEPVGNEWNSGA